MSALPGKRGLRWLLLASASLSAIAVFLLATATANTALFAQGYDTLLVVNGVLVALLMLVVGWQLWQLRRNLKAGVFGSRLAVRLVLLFALVAGLPGALVYRVSYNALTRQYRVASGLLTQTFNSLEEVERFIGRITSRRVASADALTKGARYDAAVRLRLDVNQLPKPILINALASREWTLASDWHRWSFTP